MTKQEWLDNMGAVGDAMWERAANELEKRGVDFEEISDSRTISALETAFDYYAKADVDDADRGVDFITEYCDGFSGYQIKELAGYVESQMYEVQDEVEHPIFTDEIRDEVFVPEHTPKEMHNMVSSLVEGAYTPTLYTDRAATKEEAADLFTAICERNGNGRVDIDGYEGVQERVAEIEGEGYTFEGAKVDRFMVHVGPNFESRQMNIRVPKDHLVMTFRNSDGQARYCIVNADGKVVKQPLSRLEYNYDMDHATYFTYYERVITEIQEKFEEMGIPVERDALYALIHEDSDFRAEDVDRLVGSMRERIETLPFTEKDVSEEYWYAQNAVGSVLALTHELHDCGKDRTADSLQVLLAKVEGSEKMLQTTHYSVDQGIIAGAWLSIGSSILRNMILERGFRPNSEMVALFSPSWFEHADVRGAMLEAFREDAKTMSREELCVALDAYLADTSRTDKVRHVHDSAIEKLANALIEGKEINPQHLTYQDLQGPFNTVLREVGKIGADREEVLSALSHYFDVESIFTSPDYVHAPWDEIAKDASAPVSLRVIALYFNDRTPYTPYLFPTLLEDPSTPKELLITYWKYYDGEFAGDTPSYQMARSENTPMEILRELIKGGSNGSVSLSETALKNPNINEDVLIQFSKDEDPAVRAGVARAENLPEYRLVELAQDPDEGVREAAASNKTASNKMLNTLAKDESGQVRAAVAENPNTAPETLAELAKDKDDRIRGRVARNQNTPPEVLTELAKDEITNVREAVAANPNTPTETLARLARDEDSWARRNVAENKNTPSETLENLARNRYEYEYIRDIAKKRLSPDTLTKLTNISIAEDGNTSPDVLAELAKNEEEEVRKLVAKHPNTPSAALAELAKDTIKEVRALVSKNPNTPPAALKELAKENSWAVVQNPSTPPEALVELAKDEYLGVREMVAKHPNTPPKAFVELVRKDGIKKGLYGVDIRIIPPEAFVEMARDEDKRVRRFATENPDITPEVLAELAKDKDWEVREAVADNRTTPPEVLAVLAKDENENVRQRVAVKSHTPPEAFVELAKDEDEIVRCYVAQNYHTPPEALAGLAKDIKERIRQDVACNRNTPSEVLTELAKDENRWVRRHVACNRHTPPEVLAELAKDKEWEVRSDVARNTNTPSEVLTELAKDKDVRVHVNVAKNPNTPPEALVELAKDGWDGISWEVAKNPNTPPEALAELAKDDFWRVRDAVAEHPNTPPEVLAELAKDEYVRRSVAKNPNTPPEVLAGLAKDENADIRRYAAYNHNTPPEALAELAKDEDRGIRSAAQNNPNFQRAAFTKVPLKDRFKDVRERSNGTKATTDAPAKTAVSKADSNPGGDDNR